MNGILTLSIGAAHVREADINRTIAQSQQILLDFLKADVEVALTFADLCQTEKANDPDASTRLREKVQRAYEAIQKFLPRVPADNTEGRKQIQGGLAELKAFLESTPAD